jgi:hypothetical protein
MNTNLARFFVLAAILAAPACSDSGGGGSTVKKDSGTDSATDTKTTNDTGVKTDGGGGGACTGIFSGACGTCLEGACCTELATCNSTTGCLDDVSGGTACAASDTACSNASQALVDCASASCATECGGGGGDAGPAPSPIDPLCTAPTTAASGGSCVTLGGTFACNPVTNAGCTTAGATCDLASDGSFQCFDPPNDVALCGACDNSAGPFCKPTTHCAQTATAFGCARFCCTNADCTGGTCDTSALGVTGLGLCVK